jgi:hypothetical protein
MHQLTNSFEQFISASPFSFSTEKWTCPKHFSPIPGMYRKYETELAWQSYLAGYEAAKKEAN